jgi:hypothetical protein
MDAALSSETSANVYQIAGSGNPEHIIFHCTFSSSLYSHKWDLKEAGGKI